MASVFKIQKNKSFNFVSDIVFEGALLSDTRAVLVTELIYYILYERQQIPLPVDQLRLRTFASNSGANECGVPQMHFKRNIAQNVVDRKAKLFLEDLGQMCDNLKNSFRSCPEIDQVAILLGGTVVNPKESYVIKLPPPCPDADCLPLNSCKNTLFKQIISEDILGSLKSQLLPSNVMVLLSAPRSCPLSWFLPKHTMSPQTGNVISFNFRCVYFVPICYDLSITECDVSNLSGLEPHECTPCAAAEENSSSSLTFSDFDKQGEDTDSCVNQCDKQSNDLIHSESALQLNEANKKKECVPEKLGRFCVHKRLNYIFSARKKKEKSHDESSQISPIVSGETIKDDSMELCYTPGENVFKDLVDSTSYKRQPCDYLWYQSPVILKGFKDHIAHEH